MHGLYIGQGLFKLPNSINVRRPLRVFRGGLTAYAMCMPTEAPRRLTEETVRLGAAAVPLMTYDFLDFKVGPQVRLCICPKLEVLRCQCGIKQSVVYHLQSGTAFMDAAHVDTVLHISARVLPGGNV